MLTAVVTDINTVDEAHRAFYKEDNGKFVLQVTPAEGFKLENVDGLANALSAERNLKKGLEGKLKAFDNIDPDLARQAIAQVAAFDGITPEEAKQAKETAERLSALDPKKDAERIAEEKIKTATDKLTKDLSTQFTAEKTELSKALETAQAVANTLKTQLKTLLVTNQLTEGLTALNPLDDARDAILLLAERSIQTSEKDDGSFQVDVVGPDKNPRMKVVNGEVVPFTVADLLTEIKDKRPSLFKADQTRGVGISPNGGPGTVPGFTGKNPWAKDSWNMTEQGILQNTKPEVAKQLKALAGVE